MAEPAPASTLRRDGFEKIWIMGLAPRLRQPVAHLPVRACEWLTYVNGQSEIGKERPHDCRGHAVILRHAVAIGVGDIKAVYAFNLSTWIAMAERYTER